MSKQSHQSTTKFPGFDQIFQTFTPIVRSLGWEGIALFLLFLVLLIAEQGGLARKNRIGTARMAGRREILKASFEGQLQLLRRKQTKGTFYIGTPKLKGILALVACLIGIVPTLFIPRSHRSVLVLGAPETGKTHFFINPAIRSFLDQGVPTIIYAFKEDMVAQHVAYAADRGYKAEDIHILAPGFPYSSTLNIVETLISDPSDTAGAQQLAHVLNLNVNTGSSDHQNKYFQKAADSLVKTVLLLARSHYCFSDIWLSAAILLLPDLEKRMRLAGKHEWIDLWTQISAANLISVADAGPTAGGIVSTAQHTFSNFLNRDFLPAVCGKTTIPIEMTGRKLLIFQIDQEKQDIISPLLAAALHVIVKKNMAKPRSERLGIFIDEGATTKFPEAANWMNWYRQNGLSLVISFQAIPQMERLYGKETTREFFTGSGTKVLFNPGDYQTCEYFSNSFGKEDVVIQTKSNSYGKSSSRSRSEQLHQRHLVSADEIDTLDTGHCFMRNLAYRGRGHKGRMQAGLPCFLDMTKRLPKEDVEAQNKSEELWKKYVCDRLIARAQRNQIPLNHEAITQELKSRQIAADSLFPPLPVLSK